MRKLTPREALDCGPNCQPADKLTMQRAELILYAMNWDGFITMNAEIHGLVVQTAYSQPNPFLARMAAISEQS